MEFSQQVEENVISTNANYRHAGQRTGSNSVSLTMKF
jgi:hypothetical protein